MKKTSVAATDDVLNFDVLEGELTLSNINDDIPTGEAGIAEAPVGAVESPSFAWVCSVYKMSTESNVNGYASIVIDSGASASVCSKQFVMDFFPSLWLSRASSRRSFKFGDSRVFVSLVSLIIPCHLKMELRGEETDFCFGLVCDIADSLIPILLSRASLIKMDASLLFSGNKLVVGKTEGTVQLSSTKSGHMILPAVFRPEFSTLQDALSLQCFPVQGVMRTLSESELKEVHVQLGHAASRQLIPILRAGQFAVDLELISEMIDRCGCTSARARSFVSIANSHLAPYPGYAIFIDAVYLRPNTGHQYPYMMIADSFSRFAVCVPSKSLRPSELLRLFEVFWMAFLGKPRFMIRDG